MTAAMSWEGLRPTLATLLVPRHGDGHTAADAAASVAVHITAAGGDVVVALGLWGSGTPPMWISMALIS